MTQRREDQRAWAMVESAPDAMLLADADGQVLVVNRQVEVMFGYDRSELVGNAVEQLIPAELRGRHKAHRTRYRVDPQVRPMGAALNLLARHRDGSEFPVEVSLSPLSDETGSTVVASIRDISDRVKIESQLHLVQASIDATQDGVFMFNPGTLAFSYVNQGAIDQTSYTREQLLTMTPLHIKPEFTAKSFEALIEPLIQGTVPRLRFQTTHRDRHGSDIPVEVSLEFPAAERPTAERVVVALVRDITERRAAERQRERQQQALQGMSDIRTHILNDEPTVGVFDLICRCVSEICAGASVSVSQPEGDLNLRLIASCDSADVVGSTWKVNSTAKEAIETRAPVIEKVSPNAAQPMDFDRRLSVPMVADERLIAVITAIRPGDAPMFSDSEVAIVESFSNQAAAALEITRARNDRQRLDLLEDRERIGRDLHDVVIQRLFAAGMGLQSIASSVAPPEATERIASTVTEIDAAINELRTAIFGLDTARSGPVEDQIRDVVAEHAAHLGFEPDVELDAGVNAIPAVVVEQLLPTIGEALSNIARHAEATSATVTVGSTDGLLTMTISDDGKGVSEQASGGRGLPNMTNRARRVGGSAELGGNASGGATLSWTALI